MTTRIKQGLQKGFTLIELVIVIVVLGILVAVAIPRYENLSDEALSAAQNANVAATKAAYAIYIGENGDQPTITELVAQMGGGSVTAVATGVQVTINSTNYTVLTYTDATCTTATTAVGNTVACVGDIS